MKSKFFAQLSPLDQPLAHQNATSKWIMISSLEFRDRVRRVQCPAYL